IVARGHAPEHACLYGEDLGVLISGDQILPRITPHIGVYPGEPEANPLSQYLDSLPLFEGLPEATLVLPSHGDPFRGLHARLAQLAHHHDHRLLALLAACAEGVTARELLPVLFRRELDDRSIFMALGEALAHLHLLECSGKLTRTRGSDGMIRFRRSARSEAAA
ncbi:MAG: MBL fold metallo-hydrolase, partial [Alphaproteobacteria bacterium]|nr:MBL fold metallo-hydrolase [Alphaproteobacteria bacterium]